MKKLLILIALISISLPTYCSSNIQGLEWSEICPYEYLNARVLSDSEIERYAIQKGAEQSNVFYCKYHGPTAKILRTITIIPALDCWGAKKLATSNWRNQLKTENITNQYWLQRKKDFYNSLKTCENLSQETQAMCYLKIKEIELQKNNYYQQQISNQTIINQNAIGNMQMGIQNMNQVDTNIQLQNMNQNLYNINNNLQMLRY